MLINHSLDLPAIAYTLERGCKYEVKRWNKKAQDADERRVSAFLEVGPPWGRNSKCYWFLY